MRVACTATVDCPFSVELAQSGARYEMADHERECRTFVSTLRRQRNAEIQRRGSGIMHPLSPDLARSQYLNTFLGRRSA